MQELVFAVSFAVYTLLIVGVGLYSARFAKRSDEDYFLAGRSLGPWVAALSASASSESGWVTMGLVGWAFVSGVQAYWIIPGCLVGFLFNWFVIAGRLRTKAHDVGALTLPDLFAFSFKERLPILRIMSVIVILVAMMLYVAAQFAAAGKAFDVSFTAVDYKIGVLIGAAIVLIYTVLGGFRAACWTDFAQALVMVGTLVLFPIYLLFTQGGFEHISDAMSVVDDEGAYMTFWPQATGLALAGFLLGSGAMGLNLGYPGQPHVLVRFMALRDKSAARIGGIIAAVWATCVYWGAVTIGLLVRALTETNSANPDHWSAPLSAQLADPEVKSAGETGLVLAANHMIPGVLSGMVLAAVLAAICSTADSQLVVAASSAANDIYARLFDQSKKLAHLLVNRIVMFGLGLVAILLVIDQEIQVYVFVLDYGWAILGASFGPQLILLLLWRRATYAGCVAGMATGFLTALLWKLLDPLAALAEVEASEGVLANLRDRFAGVEVYNLTLGFTLALIVNIVVSLLTQRARNASGS